MSLFGVIKMKLYLISQDINDGSEAFDSAVVAAESENDARTIHPAGSCVYTNGREWLALDSYGYVHEYHYNDWLPYKYINKIKVECIGVTTKDRGVICASFNAG